MSIETPGQSFGALLREWRGRRRMSQFDLACDAGISTKHLSFLETGRSRPSLTMLLHLAACLNVPLRQRNVMMGAAGFAPAFEEHAFGDPALEMVRRSVETVLSAHDPNPALAIDRHWTMISANRAVARLVAGAEPSLLRPPVNFLRLSLHPAGLASRIVNLAQWRAHMIARLRGRIEANGDPALDPSARGSPRLPCPRSYGSPSAEPADNQIAVQFRLATIDGVLSFFDTTTSFGAPVDITVSELAIEAFLPADAQTAEVVRRIALRGDADQPAWVASREAPAAMLV